MSSEKAEIKACVCHWLGELADDSMSAAGFTRRRKSLTYSRETEDDIQKIEVAIEHHPSEDPNAAAAVYPQYIVAMGTVNKTVETMTGGNAQLGGQFDITLRGPIEWTSPKGVGARWHIYQPDSVPDIVSSFRGFVARWTIPFLDRFSRLRDLCNATLKGDDREIHSQMEVLRVVAAKSLCGRDAEALEVMEEWFGAPGPRKRYGPVFEYLANRLS